jgi:DNA-binding MarR family transcriptional regulator
MSRVPVFDPVIHAPGRLQICAILSAADEAEFAMLRESLGVSDSVLSKHLKQLEEAGYVRLNKQAQHGRQRTWLSLTEPGRAAFAAHVAELTRLAGLAGVGAGAGAGFVG